MTNNIWLTKQIINNSMTSRGCCGNYYKLFDLINFIYSYIINLLMATNNTDTTNIQ